MFIAGHKVEWTDVIDFTLKFLNNPVYQEKSNWKL
jgi:hypothetical protein